MRTDLILLHAPSVYDFREKSILYGPMSDLVPSSPIFEMYPIGFLTMANYLEKRGISVRIINIAYLMMRNKKFDVPKYISRLKPKAFGIDLHWMPHCQGATKLAEIVKKCHPEIPVIFGGFSSSFFHSELIDFEQVDFIIRGDSAEEPLYQLVKTIKEKKNNFKEIPNLVWKENGSHFVNPIECVSKDLQEVDFDYRIMFRHVARYLDLNGIIPFDGWMKYPVTTIPIIRGCNRDCSGCGGSRSAFEDFGCRKKPAFRDPVKLVDEILVMQKYINAPVFILGDITQGGKDYLKTFFMSARRLRKDIQIFFEFFEPPEKWFYDEINKIFDNVCYEISPDSHDENIRKIMGKSFSNTELLESIKYALNGGAKRYDLYFMTGLPHQTKESVLDTVRFCEEFYEEIGWDKRFMPFISPMAPFVDPASRAFVEPEKFGYTLTRKTLKDHIEAITMPSWKYILNYESSYITRDDLVDSTYEAALGLNRLKGRAGAITLEVMSENESRIKTALVLMKEIDDIVEKSRPEDLESGLELLKEKMFKYSLSTVCEKSELQFPLTNRSFKWLSIAKAVLFPSR
ncbi:MAG: TIGR04190 family B12-binding domain/radical SAM domain protein [Actinomycetota bacterium]